MLFYDRKDSGGKIGIICAKKFISFIFMLCVRATAYCSFKGRLFEIRTKFVSCVVAIITQIYTLSEPRNALAA